MWGLLPSYCDIDVLDELSEGASVYHCEKVSIHLHNHFSGIFKVSYWNHLTCQEKNAIDLKVAEFWRKIQSGSHAVSLTGLKIVYGWLGHCTICLQWGQCILNGWVARTGLCEKYLKKKCVQIDLAGIHVYVYPACKELLHRAPGVTLKSCLRAKRKHALCYTPRIFWFLLL